LPAGTTTIRASMMGLDVTAGSWPQMVPCASAG
jgi:hypothetical protein